MRPAMCSFGKLDLYAIIIIVVSQSQINELITKYVHKQSTIKDTI
jgi:hypothetical protein